MSKKISVSDVKKVEIDASLSLDEIRESLKEDIDDEFFDETVLNENIEEETKEYVVQFDVKVNKTN